MRSWHSGRAKDKVQTMILTDIMIRPLYATSHLPHTSCHLLSANRSPPYDTCLTPPSIWSLQLMPPTAKRLQLMPPGGSLLQLSMALDQVCRRVHVKIESSEIGSVFPSVSNGSGLPGFGLGQERLCNPTHSVMAGLIPGPDINARFFGRFKPGPRFHITVPATFTPIKYLSTDCITI
jgi:hypothetical protein